VQLSNDNLCNIFGSELRPKVCGNLQPSPDMCSTDRDAAITYLLHLESSTAP
ncbi:Fe-S-cluster oxidoreductase, partial [Klebsiella pneumoniae]